MDKGREGRRERGEKEGGKNINIVCVLGGVVTFHHRTCTT